MLLPATTGDGAPEFVTLRLTAAFTSVLTVVELLAALGSLVAEDTEEVAAMVVPSAVAALTLTITLMFATEPAARLGFVQETLPVPPTAGVVHVQPAGTETAWNVVLAGVASRKVTVAAAAGPLFAMLCV
jgi:hypothetical protein